MKYYNADELTRKITLIFKPQISEKSFIFTSLKEKVNRLISEVVMEVCAKCKHDNQETEQCIDRCFEPKESKPLLTEYQYKEMFCETYMGILRH